MGLPRISSRAAAAGLVGLVVLDVVVVGTAFRSTRTSGIDTSPVGSASTPIESTGVPVRPAAPLQIILTAVNKRLAWRASAGSCAAGGATLATTADGGRTWAEVKPPLRRIVRVRLAASRVGFVVGAAFPLRGRAHGDQQRWPHLGFRQQSTKGVVPRPQEPQRGAGPWPVCLPTLWQACGRGPGPPLGRPDSGAVRRRFGPFDDELRFGLE